jgi:hypothetical protein
MSYTIQATTLLARGTEETQDKLLGLPRRDVFTVAPGFAARRVPVIQPTWDGQGAVPLGWSSYRGSSRRHPTLTQFATPLDAECPAAMANGRRSRLNASEQTKMTADLAAAVAQLPGDWFPAGAQATKADDGGRT